MVMTRSFIACSSAAWVFGGVRLISSASSNWVKIGPLVRMKVLVWKLNRFVPSTSPGIRSGVNWIRPNCSDRLAANVRAISVLAVPGTPSSRMWPPTRRLVSIRSITSSWPTTALRTSPRMPSAIARMSCTSIDDFPPPSVNVPRQPHQRRSVAPPAVRERFGFAHEGAAIGSNAARRSDTLQPGNQRGCREPARRVKLAGDVAYGLEHVPPDHHLMVAGEFDQFGDVLQQSQAPGAHRRRRRLWGAEASEGGPQHQCNRDRALDGCDDERETEQQQQRAIRFAGEAMQRFVEHDSSGAGEQVLEHRHGERRIARRREAMIGNDIRIGQHPDRALARNGRASLRRLWRIGQQYGLGIAL